MKVTIITAVFNRIDFIESCITSVLNQNYHNIEYIVIDGGSEDGTIDVIFEYIDRISYFESGRDLGIYDALNKGLDRATGDIVGILNSDDLFATKDVISSVVNCFNRNSCDCVYGKLNFISKDSISKINRLWDSGLFTITDIEKGWMPAHPSFYLRRALFDQFGKYSLKVGYSADYELMLRMLYTHRVYAVFVDKIFVLMRTGGVTNSSLSICLKTLSSDYKALKNNNIKAPFKALLGKKLRKVMQYKLC